MRIPSLFLGTMLAALGWALPAQAISADVATRDASLVGETYTFRTVVTDSTGDVQYRYSFGDGAQTDFTVGQTEVTHTYTDAGHYPIVITVKDASGGFAGASFVHTVHYPLLPKRANTSTDIVYDEARNRIYNVNRDNDSISSVDATALQKVIELPVYKDPEALCLSPDGKLWVLHRDDYAIAIVNPDTMAIEKGFRLPYASRPIGLAMSPTGDAAYVTLMGTGKLLKLNPTSGETEATLDVGPTPRGLSVSQDGKDVYVTRFISTDAGGEVVHVDASTMTVAKRFDLIPDTTTPDTDQSSRGLPNYLFSVAISPDGRQAWVPGNKDNIFRGTFRDQNPLSQDNTVRPLVAVINLLDGTEGIPTRIDLDDRNLATHVEFTPMGDYAFVTLTGSNLLELRDAYTGGFITALQEAGVGPRGSVLGPQGRLFVHGSLTRKLVVYDVSNILTSADQTTNKIAEISTIDREKLAPNVLLGKQIFFNSADGRMTLEGYLSCATCHFDGDQDGRVFDFTSEGDGLRNTTSLLGRRGTGQGNVHWSGDFDEIQDFENQIRHLFNGSGFMSDADYQQGTRKDPLGDKKAGVSPDLDALAAFVTTLDHVDPSPYRNPDGTMTADALAGKILFGKLGCDFCHVGADFTDSSRGMLHDVGTIKPGSGTRAGAPLLGIDTPTLLGVWETAPYLHDGSAPTLRDVLTTANPNDEHGFISSLTSQQVDQLVAYLQQIDNELPPHRLPFEPSEPSDAGVVAGVEAGVDAAMAPSAGAGAGGIPEPAPVPMRKLASPSKGCACRIDRSFATPPNSASWPLSGLALVASGFIRRSRRRRAAR